jgi:hypothetical protein
MAGHPTPLISRTRSTIASAVRESASPPPPQAVGRGETGEGCFGAQRETSNANGRPLQVRTSNDHSSTLQASRVGHFRATHMLLSDSSVERLLLAREASRHPREVETGTREGQQVSPHAHSGYERPKITARNAKSLSQVSKPGKGVSSPLEAPRSFDHVSTLEASRDGRLREAFARRLEVPRS